MMSMINRCFVEIELYDSVIRINARITNGGTWKREKGPEIYACIPFC